MLISHTTVPAIYPLSLHDALPIFPRERADLRADRPEDAERTPRALDDERLGEAARRRRRCAGVLSRERARSEEHTPELQSRRDLVCRLLLEKKNKGY